VQGWETAVTTFEDGGVPDAAEVLPIAAERAAI
jgi:hypothetical protein